MFWLFIMAAAYLVFINPLLNAVDEARPGETHEQCTARLYREACRRAK